MNLNLNLKRIAAATCPSRADLVSAVLYDCGARKQTYNKAHGLMAAAPCCVNETTKTEVKEGARNLSRVRPQIYDLLISDPSHKSKTQSV